MTDYGDLYKAFEQLEKERLEYIADAFFDGEPFKLLFDREKINIL